MPATRDPIQFRTPLSRTQRREVAGLHRMYGVKPDAKRFWEREYRTARGIGAIRPVKRPGGRRRKTRRSQRKSRKNRGE